MFTSLFILFDFLIFPALVEGIYIFRRQNRILREQRYIFANGHVYGFETFLKNISFELFEISLLSFYSFLIISEGSDLSRKMREAISCWTSMEPIQIGRNGAKL